MQHAVTTEGLRLDRAHHHPRRERAWGEIFFLVFVIVMHALPLVALAVGHSWGAGAEGYAIAVVLLAGAELGHELRGTVPPDVEAGRGRRP
jgi:hypothetical protein